MFDAAKYLDTPEAVVRYLEEALDSGDVVYLAKAVRTALRALRRMGILSAEPRRGD